jgi:hypothetical protein
MRRLIAIVDDPEAPYSAHIAAASAVLDRAWGKAKQSVEIDQQGKTLEQMLLAIAAAREAEQAPEARGTQGG